MCERFLPATYLGFHSGSALPSPLSLSKCRWPYIQEEDTTTPHAAAPPRHPQVCRPDAPPGHDSQQSSILPSPPNYSASANSPHPPVDERETVTRPSYPAPATPTQPQPASCPSAGTRHAPTPQPLPTANCSLASARGQNHKRKYWRKATTARQGLGPPPTPLSNPGGALACRPPTLLHGTPRCTMQAGRLAPPPKRTQRIPINVAHCLAKTPSPEPGPTEGPGTKAMDGDPKKSKQSREGRNASPSTRKAPRPKSQPQPRSQPEGPLPLSASNPRQQAANRGCHGTVERDNLCGTPMTHPHSKALHECQCDGVGGGRCQEMGREGLGGKMPSQGASSPADPNRHPRSLSSNKGGRHRHIHRAKG
ncbi:hypothetical protein CRENBAI_002932 [Crenichthys baileyi]|uniref:Uncharacterized protein n=1 Tax=Crenichthys baileyi TaxID=28760 RepID=A0AAV9RP17_9TELE